MSPQQPDLFSEKAEPESGAFERFRWSAGQLAALLALDGIGSAMALKCANQWPDPADFCTPSEKIRVALGRLGKVLPDRLPEPLMESSEVKLVGFFDREYPARLRDIHSPPAVLWVRGALPSKTAGIAVVGTRNPDEFGRRVAKLAGQLVAEAGLVTVSGLALGCDALAHDAALDAGGYALAFLGGSLMSPEPKSNSALATRILDSGGALVSEVPPETKNSPRTLVTRDRLQSGFSEATIICQTGIPGGTLHAARECLRQKRTLIVAKPNSDTVNLESSMGNLALCERSGFDTERLFGKRVVEISDKHPLADLVVETPGDLKSAIQGLL